MPVTSSGASFPQQNVFKPLSLTPEVENKEGEKQDPDTATEVNNDTRPPGSPELRSREKHMLDKLTADLAKLRISGASTPDAGDWPVITGTMIQEAVLKKMVQMNDDPTILTKRPDEDQANQKITEELKKIDFERRQHGKDDEYVYTGDNPAQALREFSRVRPIVHSPSSRLNVLSQEILLDMLGNAHFNYLYTYDTSEDSLVIGPDLPPVPVRKYNFYCSRQEKTEVPLRADAQLRKGDYICIRGPADAHTWHPDCEWNEIHVLVDKSETGEVSLVAFGSNAASVNGPCSYDGFRERSLEKRNAPLTFRSFKALQEMSENYPQKFAPHSSICHKSAYDWLQENHPDEFAEALELSKDTNLDLDQPTGLFPPKSDSIRGVVEHIRMRAGTITLEHYLSGFENEVRYPPPNSPHVPEDREFGDLIPGFETQHPHQRQLYVAMEDFYEACIDLDNPSFPGLILFGSTGTGKTMACEALAKRLEEKACRVWQANSSSTLLSPDERAEFEALALSEPPDDASDEDEDLKEIRVKWMMEKFEQDWKNADVILIDNAGSGVLRFASDAIVRHAKEVEEAEGKKFLLIYNHHLLADPNQAFESGWNTVYRIHGPDFRTATESEDDEASSEAN